MFGKVVKIVLKILVIVFILYLIYRFLNLGIFSTVKNWLIKLFKNFFKGIKVIKDRFK